MPGGSPYNDYPEVAETIEMPKKVEIHDVTITVRSEAPGLEEASFAYSKVAGETISGGRRKSRDDFAGAERRAMEQKNGNYDEYLAIVNKILLEVESRR
jgi:hypothetical protein